MALRALQEERAHSAAQAARLNAAYAVLRKPLTRARYLVRTTSRTHLHALAPSFSLCVPSPRAQLGLHGAAPAEEGTIADAALLAEVMEAREAADEARGDSRQLAALAAQAQAALGECEEALRAAFGRADLVGAAAATTRLAYLTKLADELAESRHDAQADQHAKGDAQRSA